MSEDYNHNKPLTPTTTTTNNNTTTNTTTTTTTTNDNHNNSNNISKTTTTTAMQVLFLEELAEEPVQTLEDIFEFIGLDLLDEEGKKVSVNTTKFFRSPFPSHAPRRYPDEGRAKLIPDSVPTSPGPCFQGAVGTDRPNK